MAKLVSRRYRRDSGGGAVSCAGPDDASRVGMLTEASAFESSPGHLN